ncbi:hypothetical protein Y032_0040g221 [Ancylostoma ceylanicum]|uniref:Uncharacterized protein n=1 Tax=Ancylostoma ceylanicum TaxID=53326 RepID=A0A016UH30_9BILA|nr:hypothetical protein Y032_0040g221 [Ancylostoma ceylanicum]
MVTPIGSTYPDAHTQSDSLNFDYKRTDHSVVPPTPTTLTGSSVAPSTFQSSFTTSSTHPNVARSNTNILMSEDAGKTPPLCSPPLQSIDSLRLPFMSNPPNASSQPSSQQGQD